jgi:hypothetical protein
MQAARSFHEAAARRRISRFGKRLSGEIYVASEASATLEPNYAPLSNFSALLCVALPWTPGTQMLSSPEFPWLPNTEQGRPLSRRFAIKHLISGGFSS